MENVTSHSVLTIDGNETFPINFFGINTATVIPTMKHVCCQIQ